MRGRAVKYAVNKLENNSQHLEELACDKAAAMQFAKLLNSGVVEEKYIKTAIEQLIRFYITLQLWGNLKELFDFHFTLSDLKQHTADHAFCIYRVGFIAMYVVSNLERDCEFSPDVFKREVMDYHQVFQDMTYIVRSNLKYGSAFSISKALGDEGEGEMVFQEAIREDYKDLGRWIMDELEYRIHSD